MNELETAASTASAASREASQATTSYHVLPIMIALCIGGFIGMFSETALNIALNDLMETLSITASTAQWLTTGYLLTLGVLVPVSGLLMHWFTTRQLYIASLVFSIVGGVVAALSPNFELLLIGRILQAFGIGIMLPLIFNMILIIFPPEKRGAALGTIGLVIMFAPAAGPSLAGLTIEYLSWNYIFWFTIPFLLIALYIGIRYMQNVSTITKPRIDILSIALSTVGFGGIVFGFSRAGEGQGGWTEPTVICSLIIGALVLLAFCVRQSSMKQPMLNLRVFQYPMYTIGVLLVFVCFMVIMSTMLILPLYLQNSLAMTTMAAGFVMLPGGIVNGLLAPAMGMLYDRIGPRKLVIPGIVLIALVLLGMTGLDENSSPLYIIVLHCLLMAGISMVMMPAQTNGLNALPPHLHPDGTAFMNTLQQISGAVSTAVAATIMTKGIAAFLSGSADPTATGESAKAMAHGAQHSFVFALIAAVVGVAAGLFIRRAKTAHGAKRSMPTH